MSGDRECSVDKDGVTGRMLKSVLRHFIVEAKTLGFVARLLELKFIPSRVILGKLLYCFVPQFPHL